MFCFKIVAVLGMHFCDPNQLIATKQRNKLAAANKALCYLTRGSFKEDQHTQASLTCVCLSLRLFVRTIWLDVAEVRSRSSNENRKRRMLRRRLLSMRRIDRPPQAKKIWGLRRIVDHGGSLLAPGRATADLADVRGSR